MRFTAVGDIAQVIGVVVPGDIAVTLQLRFTEPTKPLVGVAVMVNVLFDVAPGLMLILGVLATRPKPGALIATFTATDCVTLPDIPVTVKT